jgi:hypothetical protein
MTPTERTHKRRRRHGLEAKADLFICSSAPQLVTAIISPERKHNDLPVNHRRRCDAGCSSGRGGSFEADPVASVRENFVACEVLSQLQRVMENPRFLLAGECVPLRAGDRVRVYASRGPYACIYPHDTIAPCKWTHQKALSK